MPETTPARPVPSERTADTLPDPFALELSGEDEAGFPFDRRPHEVLELLTAALDRKVVSPLLAATTAQEFRTRLAEGAPHYVEAKTAFRVLQPLLNLPPATVEDDERRFREAAGELGGPEAVDLVDFASSTHDRARALRQRLSKFRAYVIDDPHDAEVARSFRVNTLFFDYMRAVILMAADREHLPGRVGVECAFDLLRRAAIGAYTAAREQLDLRVEPESGPYEQLPFDEEDRRLAR
jgi:hypothetical protein